MQNSANQDQNINQKSTTTYHTLNDYLSTKEKQSTQQLNTKVDYVVPDSSSGLDHFRPLEDIEQALIRPAYTQKEDHKSEINLKVQSSLQNKDSEDFIKTQEAQMQFQSITSKPLGHIDILEIVSKMISKSNKENSFDQRKDSKVNQKASNWASSFPFFSLEYLAETLSYQDLERMVLQMLSTKFLRNLLGTISNLENNQSLSKEYPETQDIMIMCPVDELANQFFMKSTII